MGTPFIAFTVHAGMTQIPARSWRRQRSTARHWQRFRDVTCPSSPPLFVVLIALSTLWDLRVFTQIFVLQQAGRITRETNLLGVWAYRVSMGGTDFDIGAAIAIVMVGLTLLLTFVYLRNMFARRSCDGRIGARCVVVEPGGGRRCSRAGVMTEEASEARSSAAVRFHRVLLNAVGLAW